MKRLTPEQISTQVSSFSDPETLATVQVIIEKVRQFGEQAIRKYALQFGEIIEDQSLWVEEVELEAAFQLTPADDRELLHRVADRIRTFAQAQREALSDLTISTDVGILGHRWQAIDRAGCYAPGGRYPLPSSVLMTVIPAVVAGVKDIVLTSPKPTPITLAAAHVAGATRVLQVGGAHAIAALAYGLDSFEPRDVIVGPGNRFVTAAKKLLQGQIGIDSLAGPSELLIIADDSARPDYIAADLLAQAEHDDDAVPCLLSTSEDLIKRVEVELSRQLSTLPTRATAERALENGFSTKVSSIEEAVEISNKIAPEHLEVHTRELPSGLRNYGALFIGQQSAEVFGDYGIGPNHTLPTGRAARFSAGLSVIHFLRAQTFIEVNNASELIDDTARFARLEGLEAHARAAEIRR